MSPPGFIDTPSPSASWPMKRTLGAGGSAKPRHTRAIVAEAECPSLHAHLERRDVLDAAEGAVDAQVDAVGGRLEEAGRRDAFCACRIETSCGMSTASIASLVEDSSTQIFSSCSPRSSTFATSGTRSRPRRISSA